MQKVMKDLTVQRVRHDIVVRTIIVESVEKLANNYVRIRFVGDDLIGFVSSGFDDHVKLFFPQQDNAPVVPQLTENGLFFPEDKPKPAARDYTPRAFDQKSSYLEIDFVLHEQGPAGMWAKAACIGDALVMAGPRGSMLVPIEYDWHLLVGDETALPAIIRRLHELPDHAQVVVVLETEAPQLQALLPPHVNLQLVYAQRVDSQSHLPQLVRELRLPDGEGFAWAAAESSVVKAIRQELVDTHGLANHQIRASSYWRREDASEKQQ